MALIERTAYPRFSPRPTAGELARAFTPTLRDLDLARRTTRGGGDQQLAFLLMLKSFQRLGYFPKDDDVPEPVVAHLRSLLGSGLAPRRMRPRARASVTATPSGRTWA